MKATVVIVAFLILAALHQDFWLWEDKSLVFGFLPVGLAYHAAYSLVAALFWWLVSKLAWPFKIEQWADEEGDDSAS